MKFRVIDILTGKKADQEKIALNEKWARNLMYSDMEGFAIQEDGRLVLLDQCGNYQSCQPGRFAVEITDSPLAAAYERFKHLDTLLVEAAEANDPIHKTASALWLAIKQELGKGDRTA